ncbi:MAG: HlyD family efflux transporter periplasmic adaptor subunit [Cryomorphaceae bacterium]|jgi:adhesin transport system membrane fusion protein|nr:HlyD family efflux transporter periplasmic adaptor subunit [Cryomorphaceae bacterium]
MLNISPNNKNEIDENQFVAYQKVNQEVSAPKLRRALYIIGGLVLLIMLLPWTQNIRSNGKITTLRPEQRPQTINSIIAGRIETWFVKDGDFVNKGDTIVVISEVKDGYFDPQLINRTQQQIKNKELSVVSYEQKVSALDQRIDALIETSQLKLQQAKIKYRQARLKITADSIEFQAAETNYDIAKDQLTRFEKLLNQGLKSQTEVETRRMAMQRAQASMISAQQKLLQSRNDLIDAKVEVRSTEAKYRDEIAKAESEKMSAMTNMYDAEVDVTKLQSQAAGYSIRNGNYLILAPQDGYVTKILSSGIGETIKAGQELATIMPLNYDLAVEMYIRPMDYPLVRKGQPVRMQFDGWPAIIFSGWPNNSFGTFGGTVFAIDNFSSENGMFRILIAPDKKDHPWPKALRVGGGVNAMLLLKDVAIGYELWRNINGFPPDFYTEKTSKDSKSTPKK